MLFNFLRTFWVPLMHILIIFNKLSIPLCNLVVLWLSKVDIQSRDFKHIGDTYIPL